MLPPQRPVFPGGPVSGRVRPPVYPRLFQLFRLEPRAGVEPAFQSYQDCGLPLSDIGLVPARGVAPLFLPCHGSGLRLTYANPLFVALFCCLPATGCCLLDWGDRPESHRLGSGSRPDGSTLRLRPPWWSARVVMLHGLPLIKRPVYF